MSNPNNCGTCDHKKYPEGGHCYMFRNEPNDICNQHTGRKRSSEWPRVVATLGLGALAAAAVIVESQQKRQK